MTHDEMIAVIAAHKEGKEIQYKTNDNNRWQDCVNNKPVWDFRLCDYRIKPKPLVAYAVLNEEEESPSHYLFYCKENALKEVGGDESKVITLTEQQ